MHTKDFIAQVEALPFVGEVEKSPHNNLLTVYRKVGVDVMALVGTDAMYSIDTNWHGFYNLHSDERAQLTHLVWQYISTPVNKREPEGRYTLSAKSHVPIVLLDVEKYYMKIWKDSDFRKQQLDWIEMTFDKEWIE